MKTFDQIIEEQILDEAVINKIKSMIATKVDPKVLAKKFIKTFDLTDPKKLKKFARMGVTLNDPKFRVVLNQVMMAAGA